MRALIPYRLWSLVLGSTLACGGGANPLFDGEQVDEARAFDGFVADDTEPSTASPTTTFKAGTVAALFPGAGTSGAARSLSVGLGPETSSECEPEAVDSQPVASTGVQTVCFFGQEEPGVPAAAIEQVVEIVGNDEWVHIRLTLNPSFVDNSYGENAVGWEGRAAGGAGTAPKEPAAGGAEPPQPREPREPMARPAAGGKAGHTFQELVGSDHSEMVLLDAGGAPALHFRLDYLSAAAELASGHASLGVAGGEGRLELGREPWILASTSSLDRNLNACGLSSFTEDSPATDPQYTPNPDASAWDYRVSYELWVSVEAFGDVGFGSALIENVHASPSKAGSNTLQVLPAPCPVDPNAPDAQPEPLPPVLAIIR